MRVCLYIMVMFVNNNIDDEVVYLKEMVKYDVIRLVVVFFRVGELQRMLLCFYIYLFDVLEIVEVYCIFCIKK